MSPAEPDAGVPDAQPGPAGEDAEAVGADGADQPSTSAAAEPEIDWDAPLKAVAGGQPGASGVFPPGVPLLQSAPWDGADAGEARRLAEVAAIGIEFVDAALAADQLGDTLV